MEKLKLHSPDITSGNIERIAELFPNCITETQGADGEVTRAVDFDLLRQELSGELVEGPQERYRLDWPGKREALVAANTPIEKTLRPCREESVDFETTQNLYIEGDNLEALKLLQETYLNKVKMIYIDPPYNTGNDFIYDDNYSMTRGEYAEESGEKDEEGNRNFDAQKWQQNSSLSGRFHSEWLSMMYPRLKLARSLLREDGFIVISLDDAESDNLLKLLSEVFGGENQIATLVWDRNRKNDAKLFSVGHEYMHVFAKSSSALRDKNLTLREPLEGIGEAKRLFKKLVKKHGNDWDHIQEEWRSFYNRIPQSDPRSKIGRYSKLDIKGPYRDDGNISWPGGGGPRYEVLHPITKKPCKIPSRGWMYSSPERFWEEVETGRVVFGRDETTTPRIASYLFESKGKVMGSVFYSYAQTVAVEFRKLMGERIFDNPKSWSDLKKMIKYLTDSEDTILDFFSGSATTAHAVMALNAEDGGNRRHIQVQLPEPCDEKSEAAKAGYATIAEIGKERIRRAAAKIRANFQIEIDKTKEGTPEHQTLLDRLANLDTGFRVLKIDSSNMADVYYRPDEVSQEGLAIQVENIKSDRSPEDLLFQVLLDWGVDLASPIRKDEVERAKSEKGNPYAVFTVGENDLVACFDAGVTEELVKELAKQKPLRAVFRDASFESDAVRINVEQIFKALSPHTEVRAI